MKLQKSPLCPSATEYSVPNVVNLIRFSNGHLDEKEAEPFFSVYNESYILLKH